MPRPDRNFLVFRALDTAVSCASGLLDDPLGKVSNRVAAGGAFFEGTFFSLFAIGVSLASNSAATLLVGYRAWQVLVFAFAFSVLETGTACLNTVCRAQEVQAADYEVLRGRPERGPRAARHDAPRRVGRRVLPPLGKRTF